MPLRRQNCQRKHGINFLCSCHVPSSLRVNKAAQRTQKPRLTGMWTCHCGKRNTLTATTHGVPAFLEKSINHWPANHSSTSFTDSKKAFSPLLRRWPLQYTCRAKQLPVNVPKEGLPEAPCSKILSKLASGERR